MAGRQSPREDFMLLNRKVLGVLGAASTDSTRHALNGILLEADGSAVGCDGAILVKFTPAAVAAFDPREFPSLDGVDPRDGAVIEKDADGQDQIVTPPVALAPFILSRDSVAQLKKALPKPRGPLPILSTIALDVAQSNGNGAAVMAVTDLENPQVFK